MTTCDQCGRDNCPRANPYNDRFVQRDEEIDCLEAQQSTAAAYLAQVIRERDEAREQAERAEQERDTLVRMLVSEFGWKDQSYLHAMMHVEPAIRNLRAELEVSYKFHDVAVNERDVERTMNRALRVDIERLRNALACISLAEYESTSSASEKVHGNARIARKALEETK